MGEWLTADEAADRLKIKPATLYAYVSRGHVRRRPARDGRRSEYHAEDVAALAVRGRRARPVRPSDVVVATAITAITPQGPAYRGQPAVELAGTTGFEAVAARLWDVRDVTPWTAPAGRVAAARAATGGLPPTVEPVMRLPLIVAAAATADPLRHHLDVPSVAATARGLIATVVEVLTPTVSGQPAWTAPAVAAPDGRPPSVAARLAAALGAGPTPAVSECVDAALVLLADHELAASTLAARTAASARCDPDAVVLAGLSVLSGTRHGAASRPVEMALADIDGGADPAAALGRHTTTGTGLPGFGHPLYPDGDPRAVRLFDLLGAGPLRDRTAALDALRDTAAERGLPPPNIDTAVAGLCRALGAPVGSAGLLFAVARMAGWISHALEQYAEPELLRPRAVYTGPPPEPRGPGTTAAGVSRSTTRSASRSSPGPL